MADKSFGVKELNILGTGTPSISSPTNTNLNLTADGSGKVVFTGNATKGSGQFVLNCENNSHGIIIKGPPHSAAASYTLTLPNNDGNANQVLKTNGSGVLSWTDNTGGDTNQNAFSNFVVSGQSTVSADSETDSVTFVAGSNMTITTNASGDSITFASSGGGGGGSGVTIQDEGSTLSTTATTLNFVGSGVTASGTGATKTISITATGAGGTTVYVAESADANLGYNIPFMNVQGTGGGDRGLQIDNGGFGFNPGSKLLYINNITSTTGNNLSLQTLSTNDEITASVGNSKLAVSVDDVAITGLGATSRGLGHFKYTGTLTGSSQYAYSGNVAIGYSAGHNQDVPVVNPNRGYNVFIGRSAGEKTQFGGYNVFLGQYAGQDCISGSRNVAIGQNAGDGLVSGNNNIYIGMNAVASGSNALNEVVIGDSNITKFTIPGIDFKLKDNGGTPTQGHVLTVDGNGEAGFEGLPVSAFVGGVNNRVLTAMSSSAIVGESTLTFTGSNLTCGDNLIGIGNNSLSTNNVVFGNITTSSSIDDYNVLIGYQSGNSSTGVFNSNVAIGYKAQIGGSGIRNISLGYQTGKSGTSTICIGQFAGTSTENQSDDNIFIGKYVGAAFTGGKYNIGLGAYSLYSLIENDNDQSKHGHIAIGYSSMYNYSTVDYAGNTNENAGQNIAIGGLALSEGKLGGSNIAIGELALAYLNMGSSIASSAGVGNVAIGDEAGRGSYQGAYNASDTWEGDFNTCIGWHAAEHLKDQASNNTIIGQSAATSLTTGSTNTCLGSSAGKGTYYIGTGSNNLCLGTASVPSANNVSNEITLGNSSIASLRCNVQTISSLSDARDKTDIVDIPTGLDFLNDLRPVKFKWQTRDGNGKDGSISAGFLAQDLQKTQKESSAEFLNLVMDNNPDRLEAREGQLIPVLVKAIQELSAKNDALEARIKTLEG